MPSEAYVTPDTIWKEANLCRINVSDPPPRVPANHDDVDVLPVQWTNAKIHITKDGYPKGVVVLNDWTYKQNHNNQITTENVDEFDLIIVPHDIDDRNPVIIRNVSWPSGEVILWEPPPE
jgi:hypothetical protein